MLGVPTDKLGVYTCTRVTEDAIYVSTTLVVHGPCTHGSHLAGAEYFREADCSTVLYGNSSSLQVPGIQQAQQNARRNCLESRESVVVQRKALSQFRYRLYMYMHHDCTRYM
jgi:hypothetical protein